MVQFGSSTKLTRSCLVNRLVSGHGFSRAVIEQENYGLSPCVANRLRSFAVEQTARKSIEAAVQRRKRSEPGALAPGKLEN